MSAKPRTSNRLIAKTDRIVRSLCVFSVALIVTQHALEQQVTRSNEVLGGFHGKAIVSADFCEQKQVIHAVIDNQGSGHGGK